MSCLNNHTVIDSVDEYKKINRLIGDRCPKGDSTAPKEKHIHVGPLRFMKNNPHTLKIDIWF